MRNKLEYVEKNKFIYIVGRKYSAIANGSFIMVDYDTNKKKDLLLKVFMEFWPFCPYEPLIRKKFAE